MRILAFVLALLAITSPLVRAEVELLPPDDINNEVTELKDALNNPASTPVDLRVRADAIFETAENTHHMPYTGTFGWQRAERMNEYGGPVTESQIMRQYKTLMIKEPPRPADEEREQREWKAYLAAEKVFAAGKMKKDERGELQAGVVAAYVWDLTQNILGVILFQQLFLTAAEHVGEIATATAAHEGCHAGQHLSGTLAPDEVVVREIECFAIEGDQLERVGAEKFAREWDPVVNDRTGLVPQAAKDYMKHLAELRHYYSTGQLEYFVKEKRGYRDRPKAFHMLAPVENKT